MVVLVVVVVLFVILSGLKKESIWLAYYVSLSRPRSFGNLLSHGLPDRSTIESGPPEQIEGLRRTVLREDCHDEDRLRQGPTATGMACASLRSREMQLALWRCCSACPSAFV